MRLNAIEIIYLISVQMVLLCLKYNTLGLLRILMEIFKKQKKNFWVLIKFKPLLAKNCGEKQLINK